MFSRTNCDYEKAKKRTFGVEAPNSAEICGKDQQSSKLESQGETKASDKIQREVGPPEPSRGVATRGQKVHGRALKLSEKIRKLANEYAENHDLVSYFLESPFQVRHLAAKQLQISTKAKGTVASELAKGMWDQEEACSSCDDRRTNLEPGVKEFLQRRAEAKKKAKASSTAKQ